MILLIKNKNSIKKILNLNNFFLKQSKKIQGKTHIIHSIGTKGNHNSCYYKLHFSQCLRGDCLGILNRNVTLAKYCKNIVI